MSTPLALQLDDSNWMRNKKVLAISGAAVVLIGSLGIWLSRGDNRPSLQSSGVPIAAANATSVVTAPHTKDGAVAAAASFLQFYGDTLQSTDPNQTTFFDGIIDSESAPQLVDQIQETVTNVQKTAPDGLAVQLTPAAYKVVTYSNETGAVVNIWSSMVVGTGSDSKVYWTTSEVSLKWKDDHYYVTKWVVRPGPTPENSGSNTGESADNAASLIAVNGYTAFRTAPANASDNEASIAVSTQGSK